MTVSISDYSKRFSISLLIFFGINGLSVFSQIDLVVNKYAKVTNRQDYQITVDDATGFSAGDYVLLIQMKGVSINTDIGNYGSIQDRVGKPGEYEFLIINTVSGTTITFLNKIKKYDPSGLVQIVKVPFYNSASFGSEFKLTCKPWDAATGTGGVLAMIVGGKLTLNENIDVSGRGFYGGIAASGDGLCSDPSGITGVYEFPASYTNAGFKGEGSASHYTPGVGFPPVLLASPLKGQGAIFSGGGGGNGRYSGGGGGSNRGRGWDGGLEDIFCSNATTGGRGGQPILTGSSIDTVSRTGGVFMGGGGGSSTHGLNPAVATNGGNGGGIVFIMADSIQGNNKTIIVSGDSARTATGINSGAGGGGAGGSVMIFSRNFTNDNLRIKINGAKGGDVYHSSGGDGGGAGGGGGGGYLAILKSKPLPVNVSIDSTGGPVSLIKFLGEPSDILTNGGEDGMMRTGVSPVLTGFLFNSISSEVTGNQIDSTCSNVNFGRIIGTSPLGGVKPYTITWEKSEISETGPWDPIPAADGLQNYSPGSLAVTTWFRRIIKDNGGADMITDPSKPVKIIVHQKIINNFIIASPDSICFGSDPKIMKQVLPDLVIPTTKAYYFWQASTDNALTWGTHDADTLSREFDPNPSGGLTLDTWYRRTVASGACTDSSAILKIEVIDKIANNEFIKLFDTICFGGNTDLITIAGPTGGVAGKYRYQWESSTVNATTGPWTAAIGDTLKVFDPDASVFLPVGNHFYRRIVYSGELKTCKDTSTTGTRKVWPVISGNSIQADQVICQAKRPADLTQSTSQVISGGDGAVYKWQWVYSTNNSKYFIAPNVSNGSSYRPPKLYANTWYKRVVNSSVCKDSSIAVMITVQDSIKNNIISLNPGRTDSTICSGATPKSITGLIPPTLNGGDGTVYTYKWKYSTNNSTWTDVPAIATPYYQPSSLTASTWYRRVVVSGMCKDSANSVKINVLPLVVNTIPADQPVCINTQEEPVMGLTLSGGKTGQYKFLWESSPDGTGSWTDVTSDTIRTADGANLQLPLLSSAIKYRRKVWSGPYNTCFTASNVLSVSVTQKPDPVFAGKDTLLRTFEYVYKLQALEPVGGTGEWSVPLGDGQVDDRSIFNTYVRNLSDGLNTLLWKVTSIDSVCELDTSVNITVMNIVVPQGISPNGDGKNDILKIYGLDFNTDESTGKPYQQIDLTIRNSAGAQVYHTSFGYGEEWVDWEGKTDGGADLPEGTYYYMLNILSNRVNSNQPYKGFIILKRN